MPKVSVVLPTYNGEKYIKQSIDSVLNQTFSNLELIIVNDCSTDRTLEIINEYAQKDSRVRIMNNTVNLKLPTSLNIGFAAATGEYLTWTSDDNLYLPDALEKMYEKLQSTEDIYMVCANMDYIDDQGIITGKAKGYEANAFYYTNNIGACFMYKRVVYEAIGDYNPNLFLVEDYDYWLRIRKKYHEIVHMNETLYLYRWHNDSLTIRKQKQVYDQLLVLRKLHIDYLLEQMKQSPALICHIYYEFLEYKVDVQDIRNKVIEYVPVIRSEKIEMDQTKKYVIFGAGKVGTAAAKLLGNRAICYVDNDPEKIGKRLNGLQIISFQELVEKKNTDYLILIAISSHSIYELIHQLFELGFKEYCTYNLLTQKMN